MMLTRFLSQVGNLDLQRFIHLMEKLLPDARNYFLADYEGRQATESNQDTGSGIYSLLDCEPNGIDAGWQCVFDGMTHYQCDTQYIST